MAECTECQGTGWVELLTSVRRCRSCPLGGGFEERIKPFIDEIVSGISTDKTWRGFSDILKGFDPSYKNPFPPYVDTDVPPTDGGWIVDDGHGEEEIPF